MKIGNRQNARDHRHRYAGGQDPVHEPEVNVGVEKILSDDGVRAGIDFAFKIVQIGLGVGRIGMNFRVGGDADFEISDAF